jgi:hypothetical protein
MGVKTMNVDLKKTDCTYDNSFPANINWDNPVVVQICEREQGVVLYTCKIKNTQTRCFLPSDFADKYTNRIYVFIGV